MDTAHNTNTEQLNLNPLPSFLQGQWVTPKDTTHVTEIHDASDAPDATPVATVSRETLDLAGAVNYARDTGQRELGKLSIHERALIIKKLALYMKDHRDTLRELAHATGATKADNFIDIDGGITTMLVISSKARRELPNSNVIIDGATEQLSRDGSFIGTHIYTRIPGVAVQINAFNFPVWGMLEKFAPAFIAGVPSIVKPATPTAFVTAACVKVMIDSGLLPEGSLQLICGPARELQDHLDYRDHLAFTGSANTAATLRAHDSVQQRGLRFSAEADSLNAAIMGPDIRPEDPEYQLFIDTAISEIVAKAGQKCTAIRRVLVAAPYREKVAQDIADALAHKAKLGDPRDPATTVGPLVSEDQRQDVADAVQKLIDAGGQVICGGTERPEGLEGAFFQPTVLSFENPDVDAIHDTEAFGPVVSVLGYQDIHDAIRLAERGKGSLVTSVISHDPQVTHELAMGIAHCHGRLHFLDRGDAKTSTGHGSPLPHLVHGGPGRAGGGEELGGVRGIKHYMQRTALQGTPDHLTAITGQWHQGAQVQRVTREDVDHGRGVHPFRKDLATLKIGDQFASELRTVSLQDITDFANETGDTFYAHTDEEAAMANPFFPRRVAHGYLLVSWAAGLFVDPAPGPVLANYGLENLRFITPVTYDDSIRVELTAKRITPRVTEDYGEVCWDAVLYNQNDEICAMYDVLTLVEKESSY